MDLLINQFINKMNNNNSRFHYNVSSYKDDSGVSRVHEVNPGPPPVSPTKRKHHEDSDCDEEQMNKMSRLLAFQLGGLYANTGNQDSWNYSSFQHTTLVGPQNHHVFTPFPIFAMDQPLALSKHTSDSARSTPLLPGTNMDRQQNRPSVITCGPASKRSCSLSGCHMSHHSCTSASANKSNVNTMCDPVIEEHFRRSLGNIYTEPGSKLVSITGSVDDHFTKALGDTWLQIKSRDCGPTAPEPKSS
ncbi:transcription cofactor vestigial-like protein 4 [Triplophysa dalaica]|uniref:transcription cofactor vestigial-like protein 4 n=1 Tax=Triplophysa dalaica TaxID=1582913 RepID=UPI0024E033EA|nr:transcription cofactor vestigial-like protein 4 [Triplophysa dalaica]